MIQLFQLYTYRDGNGTEASKAYWTSLLRLIHSGFVGFLHMPMGTELAASAATGCEWVWLVCLLFLLAHPRNSITFLMYKS